VVEVLVEAWAIPSLSKEQMVVLAVYFYTGKEEINERI
jgi:hypothetical protein